MFWISNLAWLESIRKSLKLVSLKRESKQVSTDELIKLVKVVVQNNYFEFNGEIKQQIPGTIET